MLSVLSVDSKRKGGARQHPSCFETHGRRFENKRNRCCTKEFCSRIFYQHLFVALCIRFVETDYGRYNFPIYQPDWKWMKTKGNVTSLEVRFTWPADRKREHDSFQWVRKNPFCRLFDRLFGDSRYRKSSLAAVLPFRIEGGSIILSARLNDSPRVMSFLLDTGADGMAIRRSLADSIGLKSQSFARRRVL